MSPGLLLADPDAPELFGELLGDAKRGTAKRGDAERSVFKPWVGPGRAL